MNSLRKISAAAVFSLMTLFFGACAIGPTETTPTQIYLLNPELARKISSPVTRGGRSVLLVGLPKPQPGYDTPRMAYLRRQYELGHYAFHAWADTPARMLLASLARKMEMAHLWGAVAQAPALSRPDYRLDCDNLALEQQFFSSPSRVRIALRAQLVDAKRQTVIGARDFEVFEISAGEDAYGGVLAANRASAILLDQMTDWLRALMNEEKTPPDEGE